jgi:hypothetical protein
VRAIEVEPVTYAAPWVERLARLGYAAKGIVYVAVGILATRSAFGPAAAPDGSTDALESLTGSTLGTVVLAIVALGLGGYVVWRLVQSILDPERKGTDLKGIVRRLGLLLSGVLYAGVALSAGRLLLGERGGGNDTATHWTAVALSAPLGRWLVAAAGAGIIAYGALELYRSWAADIGGRLDLSALSESRRRAVWAVGRAGYLSRGVVFVLVGWFAIRAAIRHDANEADGLGGALDALQSAPYGSLLLGVIAVGLVGYGVFQLVESRYRRIRVA